MGQRLDGSWTAKSRRWRSGRLPPKRIPEGHRQPSTSPTQILSHEGRPGNLFFERRHTRFELLNAGENVRVVAGGRLVDWGDWLLGGEGATFTEFDLVADVVAVWKAEGGDDIAADLLYTVVAGDVDGEGAKVGRVELVGDGVFNFLSKGGEKGVKGEIAVVAGGEDNGVEDTAAAAVVDAYTGDGGAADALLIFADDADEGAGVGGGGDGMDGEVDGGDFAVVVEGVVGGVGGAWVGGMNAGSWLHTHDMFLSAQLSAVDYLIAFSIS